MKLKNFSEREKGILSVLLLAIIYGLFALIPRFLSSSFTVFQQIYLRMGLGSLLLLVFFFKKINFRKIVTLPLKDITFLFLRTFIYFFLGTGLYVQALLITKISSVEFIESLPATALLGFILLKEKVTLTKVLLVTISFIGVVIISIKDGSSLTYFGVGELCALLSTFFIALGLVSRKWQTKKLNDTEVSFLMLLFASVQLFIGSLIFGQGLSFTGWNSTVVIILLIAGLFLAGVSFFMNYGFARIDAVLGGNILQLPAIIATFLAFFVLKEVPRTKDLFGGLLIIVSTILLHLYEKKRV